MVSLQEQQLQIAGAEEQAQQQARTLKAQQEQLEAERFQRQSLKYQTQVIAKNPRQYIGQTQKLKAQFESKKQTGLSSIFSQQKTLAQTQQQISKAKAEVSSVAQEQADWGYAERMLAKGSYPGKSDSASVKRKYEQLVRQEGLQKTYLHGAYQRSQAKVTETKQEAQPLFQPSEFEKQFGRSVKPKSTGLPPGALSISKAPTEKEMWKKSTQYGGYVGGTLDWFGGMVGRKTLQYELKRHEKDPNYQLYQLKPTSNLASFGARTSPYFTPGGAYLMLGEGVESLMSLKGKEQRSETVRKLTSQDSPIQLKPYQAKALSFVPAGVEIGMGYFGSGLHTKAKGYTRTLGREYIPEKQLIPESVRTGKETFPSAGQGLPRIERARLHKSLFETGESGKLFRERYGGKPGGFHASESQWTEMIVGGKAGKGDVAHISSSVSPHFLSIPKKTQLPKSFMEYYYPSAKPSQPLDPGVMYLTPEGGLKINLGKEVKRGTYVWDKPVKTGTGYIPSQSSEIEAVLEVGTPVMKTGKKYYSKWEGVRYPIDEFVALKGGKVPKKLKGSSSVLGEAEKSYSGLPSRHKSSLQSDITRSSVGSFVSSRKVSSSKAKDYFYGSSYKAPSRKVKPPRISRPRNYSSFGSSGIKSPSKSQTRYNQFKSSILPSYTSGSSYGRDYTYPTDPTKPTKKQRKPLIPPYLKFKKKRSRGSKRRINVRQQTRYTPSFTGASFGFFAKSKPGKIKGFYAPGVRPMLDTNVYIGKKKRKKKSTSLF